MSSAKSKDVGAMQKLLEEFKKKAPAQYVKEIPAFVIREAIMLLDAGKANEAEEKLQRVLGMEPDNAHAHCVLGYVYRCVILLGFLILLVLSTKKTKRSITSRGQLPLSPTKQQRHTTAWQLYYWVCW